MLDNYSVHHSQRVKEALPELEAADVFLCYLPSYSPKLSRIEPIWNDTKQHFMTKRTFERVAPLKHSVDDALSSKAINLKQKMIASQQAIGKTTFLFRSAA